MTVLDIGHRPAGHLPEKGGASARDRPTPRRSRATTITLLVLLVAAVIFPLTADSIRVSRVAGIGVLSLAVLGLVVAIAYAGLISLGHGAFVGLGAFAMGAYLDKVGLPFGLAFIATFATCWLSGWLLGIPALRIRGIYLALLTLGLGVIFPSLAKRFPAVTGGVSGRSVETTLDAPGWLGDDLTVAWRYYWCLAICALAFWLTNNVLRGRMGRAMKAMRDDQTAAATFGVDPVTTRAGAFALSAGLAGLAGALQAVLFPYVSHDQFTVVLSFRLYAAAIIGGAASVAAAVYGVVALIAVPAVNDWLGLLDSETFVFGAGLVIFTFVPPVRLVGWLAERVRR